MSLPKIKKITHKEIQALAVRLSATFSALGLIYPRVYAIPRGGIPAAYALHTYTHFELVNDPAEAEVFIDDIIDSGNTMRRYSDQFPGIPFLALIDRTDIDCPADYKTGWLIFPWEDSVEGETSITDHITRLIQYVGDDPTRQGLIETPARVAKAWNEWCDGYSQNPADILKVFEDGAEDCDEMVVVKDIPLYSHCEHHLAAIFGTATVAYIPNGKIVGLSKLSRLVDIYAHRLQVQERLTNQIVSALFDNLQPIGAGVMIKARHLCMESRGINRQGSITVTTALRGAFRSDPKVRAEFYEMAKA